MKVLLTSDLNPDQVNGVVISIQNLMGELEKRGVRVRLLCLSPENKSYVDGNIYYMASLPFNIYPDIRASLFPSSKLMDELLAWKPDLIHSQCEFFTYSYVESLARRLHCPIVHTYHRSDVAMTGEITLTGRVLPVGGIKEKVLAAKRYGIHQVYLPKQNLRDLREIDGVSIEEMHFVPLDTVDPLLEAVLLKPVQRKKPMVFQSEKGGGKIGFSPRQEGQ